MSERPDEPAPPAPAPRPSLDRVRAVLVRARERAVREGSRAIVDELLSQPDVERLVPALPVQELYFAIREIGIADSQELIALASPAQIQGFLDLDAWQGDRLAPERVVPWLEALMDAGPDTLARAVAALDSEVVSLFLAAQLRVYDLSIEPPPEEPEGHYYPTPDRFFLLDVLAPGEAGKRIERFVDWLYRADLDQARMVVTNAKWEPSAEAEELALRFRSARMADLGYIDPHEAIEVYRFLEPSSVKIGEGSADRPEHEASPLPALVASGLGGDGPGSFLGRALAAIGDPAERERVQAALSWLANRVMSADRVDPGDPQAGRASLARIVGWLGIGLEVLGRGELRLAVDALASIALVRIFRVGLSVTLKLQQAAEALVARAWVSLTPGGTSLLDPPLPAVIAAARERRPRYAGRAATAGPRHFSSLAEVAEVASLIEDAALLPRLFRDGLGVDPARLSEAPLEGVSPDRAAITFSTVAATLIANALLGRPPALVPLARVDLARLRETVLDGAGLSQPARAQAQAALRTRLEERGVLLPPRFDRHLDGWLDHLAAALVPSATVAPGALPGLSHRILTR